MTSGVPTPRPTPAFAAGVAPLCLPPLRRPIGWRELDDATLVARAHSVLAMTYLPSQLGHWEDEVALPQVTGSAPQQPVVDTPYLQALARMQAQLAMSQEQPQDDTRVAPPSKGIRFPGWLLTASLAIAFLQLVMWVVAVQPLEVIALVQRSVNEWQASQTGKGARDTPEQDESLTQSTPLDPAHWWQSRNNAAIPLRTPGTSGQEQSP